MLLVNVCAVFTLTSCSDCYRETLKAWGSDLDMSRKLLALTQTLAALSRNSEMSFPPPHARAHYTLQLNICFSSSEWDWHGLLCLPTFLLFLLFLSMNFYESVLSLWVYGALVLSSERVLLQWPRQTDRVPSSPLSSGQGHSVSAVGVFVDPGLPPLRLEVS